MIGIGEAHNTLDVFLFFEILVNFQISIFYRNSLKSLCLILYVMYIRNIKINYAKIGGLLIGEYLQTQK